LLHDEENTADLVSGFTRRISIVFVYRDSLFYLCINRSPMLFILELIIFCVCVLDRSLRLAVWLMLNRSSVQHYSALQCYVKSSSFLNTPQPPQPHLITDDGLE